MAALFHPFKPTEETLIHKWVQMTLHVYIKPSLTHQPQNELREAASKLAPKRARFMLAPAPGPSHAARQQTATSSTPQEGVGSVYVQGFKAGRSTYRW